MPGNPCADACRRQRILEERRQLPAWSARDKLLELVQQHPTLVVVGETGSGKTTQIPQFLLGARFGPASAAASGGGNSDGAAAGPGAATQEQQQQRQANGAKASTSGRATMIAVTQPRRVAAMTVARRVAEEMGTKLGDKVRLGGRLWPVGPWVALTPTHPPTQPPTRTQPRPRLHTHIRHRCLRSRPCPVASACTTRHTPHQPPTTPTRLSLCVPTRPTPPTKSPPSGGLRHPL